MNDKQKLGTQGELIVTQYLKTNGFEILKKNFKTKFGEIDIIAEKNELIIFVEVKTRKNKYFPISQVITPTKQKKIIKTAQFFAVKNKIFNKVLRFDVVTLVLEDASYKIDHIKNAFS